MGFDELAKEIAERSGISERKVRDDFVGLINEKISEAETSGEIVGKAYGEGEDWLLVAQYLDSVFKVISNILDHNTDYKYYEKVPLEIGIGVGKYDRWARFDGTKLIIENSTIEFLKSHILDYYRKWHKQTHSRSIKSTFVVLTESFFNELDTLDKEMCEKVEYQRDKNSQKMVSFFVAETEMIEQRGKLMDFLQAIKKSRDSWYKRIDKIFVAPEEYQNILECLKKYNIVFLVGDPEIGKTYTAVRIMWEHYCKDYKPIWHSGAEIEERRKIRQIMSDGEIESNAVTYFEDPFGKIRFEDREELRRAIGSFLKKVQSSCDKVIVTSREEVFREFKKEKLSQKDLRALIIEMRLMKPSYNREKMESILLGWATEFDCKWLKKNDFKSEVVAEAIKKIATPLGLRDFALDSKDYNELEKIKEVIREKSRETNVAFAEEIAKMGREKLVFLSLVYVLHSIKPEQIHTIYDRKCKEFDLDLEANPFEYLRKRFSPKVDRNRQTAVFEFTHPSYEEGLVSSWNRIEVKPFFLKIVNDLMKNEDPVIRGHVGFCLIKNLGRISFQDEANRIVDVLVHDKSAITRYGVAKSLHHHFNDIPFNLAIEHLKEMTNDRHREIRAAIVKTIRDNFEHIPFEESLKFITQCLEDQAAWVRYQAIECVRIRMASLPQSIISRALERCEELCNYSGWFISYFAGITYEILKERLRNETHLRHL